MEPHRLRLLRERAMVTRPVPLFRYKPVNRESGRVIA